MLMEKVEMMEVMTTSAGIVELKVNFDVTISFLSLLSIVTKFNSLVLSQQEKLQTPMFLIYGLVKWKTSTWH